MDITLNDYILNPMGKSNAVLSAITREAQRNSFKAKFNQVLLREDGVIDYHCYKDEKANQYWLHVKVPSEHVKKFYYDVVLKFYVNAETGTSNDLMKWYVKFYSNDPAFVYTYAYAFNQKGIFLNELRSKMSKEALKSPSKEKNPQEMVGYSKIIYFAYLVMENKSLNKLNMFNAQCSPLDPKSLLRQIEKADDKIVDRQSQKVSYAKKKTVSEKELRIIKGSVSGNIEGDINVRTTKRIGKIKSADSVKKTSVTQKIGKISRKK